MKKHDLSNLLLAGFCVMFCLCVECRTAAAQTRVVRVVNATAVTGATATVAVELVAQGNENSVGFSLTFNPAIFGNPQATLGGAAANAMLLTNASQTAQGRFGVVLGLPTGQSFAAGVRQLAVVTFAVAANAPTGAVAIGFGDQPIAREMVDTNAGALSTSFTAGAVTVAGAVATVSAAGFTGVMLAPESIVAGFGTKLATGVQVATTASLPTSLLGTTVKVRDGLGAERLSPLFFVAPNQINYQIPQGTATGASTITVTGGDGSLSLGAALISTVAPALFTANANGQGVPAAVALRVRADGSQVNEAIAQSDGMKFIPLAIDLGPTSEQVYLILFGTGLRGLNSLTAANLTIGGTNVPLLFIGTAPGFVGLDQINAGPLPRNLAGRGDVDVALTVEGKPANTVRISIR